MVGLLAVGPRPCFADLVDRVGNVFESFKEAPKIAIGDLPAVCYARTFQKSGSNNRAVGVFPLIDYGVLTASIIGGTGDLSSASAYSEKGLLGAGAHVRADRVLTRAFPEIAPFFAGSIPWTSNKITWEAQLGAGAAWDMAVGEAVQLLYAGPQIKF